MNYMSHNRGISLLEVMISIAIIGLLLAIVFGSFSTIRNRQILEVNRDLIVSVLTKAKSDTFASKGSKSYGVYVDTGANRLITFEGTTYIPNEVTNQLSTLDNRVSISAVDGGSTIVFERLTGFVSTLHSINIMLQNEEEKVINIFPTGVILSE